MKVDHLWLVQLVNQGGRGFNITNQKGHPLVEFRYDTEEEAKSAARNGQRAIVNAIPCAHWVNSLIATVVAAESLLDGTSTGSPNAKSTKTGEVTNSAHR